MRSSPSRRAELGRLTQRPFAHRGLHGPDIVENSRAAFCAAIAAGQGIELDVQAARDGSAFVFHDSRLDRLAEAEGEIGDRDPHELARTKLRGTGETVPKLTEILALIAGRVPLLIEVKAGGRGYHRLCDSVATALRHYPGPVGVMSFNPRVGRWFSRRHPSFLRGLVVTEAGKPRRGRLRRRLALWWARPDFLAYDIRDLPSVFAREQRAGGMPVLTWTVRGADLRAKAAAEADQIIYEEG